MDNNENYSDYRDYKNYMHNNSMKTKQEVCVRIIGDELAS